MIIGYCVIGGENHVTSQAKPNNSFNRSANSAALIVNLSVSALCARPVNSSVRFLSDGESSNGEKN